MQVHLISDSESKLSTLRRLLTEHCALTTEMLPHIELSGKSIDAVVVAADLRAGKTIAALKQVSGKLARISKRIFLADHSSRLTTVQAYALGATTVLPDAPTQQQLLAKLTNIASPSIVPCSTLPDQRELAFDGGACIAGIFGAILSGTEIDIDQAKQVGRRIADGIAENGLSHWLSSVRRHHEGTYQHCLLVTGVTIDFGLTLGVSKTDLERLYIAAMFHDIGKATIPLSVLDKPGALEKEERQLIATHPAAGFDALKASPSITPEILDAVRHHHEYLDGSGYPDGLQGESIFRPDADADDLGHLLGPDRTAQLQVHDAARPGLRDLEGHGRQARKAPRQRLPQGRLRDLVMTLAAVTCRMGRANRSDCRPIGETHRRTCS